MNRQILVVDDDQEMVKTLCDLLHLRGWSADGAFSGEAAIAAVRGGSYGAVIMDIKMPGTGGVAALKVMRAERPELPVVLMTAHATRDLVLEAEGEGALSVIAKPVELTGLLQRLERLRRGSRSILVVDHDLTFLRTLTGALRARGFLVVEATGVDDAIQRMEAEAPAAVVAHLRLEGIEPEESIVAIRRVSPAVALILYSGHPSILQGQVAAVPHEWVHAWLQKPFAVERLTALLDELVAE